MLPPPSDQQTTSTTISNKANTPTTSQTNWTAPWLVAMAKRIDLLLSAQSLSLTLNPSTQSLQFKNLFRQPPPLRNQIFKETQHTRHLTLNHPTQLPNTPSNTSVFLTELPTHSPYHPSNPVPQATIQLIPSTEYKHTQSHSNKASYNSTPPSMNGLQSKCTLPSESPDHQPPP